MAIRFEPSCDDNGQWHVGAAGNLFLDPGQNSRQLSINSPLDLRYHEASDYEDRRTSSCSPDSCDLPSHEKHLHSNSGRLFVRSPHKDNFLRENSALSPDWRPLHVQTDDFQSNERNISRMQRSKTVSDFDEPSYKRNLNFPPRNKNFYRKLSISDNVSPRACNLNAKKEDSTRLMTSSKQNGVAFPVRAALQDMKCYRKRFRTSGYNDNDLKIAATSTAVKNPVLEDVMKNGHLIHFNPCFGETDAAEALLGLSEGFFQTIQSPSGIKSQIYDEQSLTSNRTIDKASLKDVGTVTAESNAKDNTSTKPSNDASAVKEEATSGRKHFKKLICQKFVNSVQPSSAKPPETSTTSIKQSSNAVLSKENVENLTKTNDFALSTAAKMKKDGVSSASSMVEQNKRELFLPTSTRSLNTAPRSSDISPFQVQQSNNSKLIEKEQILQKPKQTPQFFKKSRSEAKTPPKLDKDLSKDSEFIKKEEVSNLYRTSKCLGSSNESIAESVDENNEANESSSDSSDDDESENEADEQGFVADQEKSSIKENNWCPDFSKRKAFILNKPTFSMPWSKSFPESNKGANTKDERTQNNHKSCGENTPISLNKPRVEFGTTSELNVEPIKQSGIHIKKATFTFRNAGKPDKTLQKSGLNVTSQAVGVLDRTPCADRNSFLFDKDKLDSNEAVKAKQVASPNDSLSNGRVTFGTFRKGDSFENLSKPVLKGTNFSEINKQQESETAKEKAVEEDLPYDKHRLPRPSARSAELEAQQLLQSKKAGRKRKLSSIRDNSKENLKLLDRQAIKRQKHVVESIKKSTTKSRHNKKEVAQQKSNKETCEPKQNGEQTVETNKQSTQFCLERTSSRRKPSRVYKHQKYTSVSMMSSTNSPRDSSEFAIISRPLNLDHRVLLANSIDFCRGSPDNLSIDSNVSSPMTSSSCSSSTSSVAGDDNDTDLISKADNAHGEQKKDRLKRHRHVSAIETNTKSDLLQRKHKMKRLLSINDQVQRKTSTRLMTSNVLANSSWQRGLPRKGETATFRLLSLFPAPASLRAGFAQGELLPGYGPSVSGHRSSLPLRWTKGCDDRDLKKKRQHERWRKMTLDMFCMGAKS